MPATPKNLYCYNVITNIMAEVFEARLRRIGNSLGIIIPNEIIQDLGYGQGDTIPVTIPTTNLETRNRVLTGLIGMDRGKADFKRDKEDRF